MENPDIRWQQRFSNYRKAFSKLQAGMPDGLTGLARMSDLEKEGLIQRFEYTHELAWNSRFNAFLQKMETLWARKN